VTPDRGGGISSQMHARSRHTVMSMSIREVPCSLGSIRIRTRWRWQWSTRSALPRIRAEEPNTRAGFVRIGERAAYQLTRVGIEGSGSYGRCVAAYLALDNGTTFLASGADDRQRVRKRTWSSRLTQGCGGFWQGLTTGARHFRHLVVGNPWGMDAPAPQSFAWLGSAALLGTNGP
jgi:hypothetical protein